MATSSAIRIKFMIIILNEINAFSRDFTTENNTKAQIQVQLEEISTMTDKFEDCQAQIESDGTKTEQEYINARSGFRKLLFDTKSTLLELLELCDRVNESLTTPSYSHNSKDKKFNMLKLPTLKPPSFNGDWQQWTAFIDDFDTMFHKN